MKTTTVTGIDMKPKLLPWRSLQARTTLFTLSIFVLSIWSLSFYVSRSLQADMERLLGEQQFSVVTSAARNVNDDLTDRVQALQRVAMADAALLAQPAALQARLEQRPLLPLLFNGGVWVAGLDGTAIADVPLATERIGVNYMERDFIAGVLKEGQPIIGRPIMGKELQSPIFSIAVPVRDAQGQVMGVLVGVTDLGKPNFLDKLTQSRYGQTGGYLLIARHHKLFVTATDKSRVMQPVPAPGVNAMHDRYMQGYAGFGLAVSSRGVLELSAAKDIPAAGWFIVGTLPAQEAFAPIRDMQQRMLFATLLLTVLAGALTWLVLRRQFAPLAATSDAMTALANSKEMPQPLPGTQQGEIGQLVTGFNSIVESWKQREAALQRGKLMLERTESMAHLASFEWDVDTNTATWSPEMYRIFGRNPAQGVPNLQGQAELYTPESAETLSDAVGKALSDGTPFELELMTLQPDGAQRPCWVKGFPERDASGRVVSVAGLVQDITERRQAEAVDAFLAQAGSQTGREPFFDALARFLAESLQMDYICIDRLEGDALNATTLSVWYDGHFEDNLTYALQDTPCGDVVGQRVCCFPASVCQFFPNDAALRELRAESYIGVTLWSHTGQPIGLIAVIGRRELSNRVQAETTLARVAGRAAGELERLTTDAALRESEARLRKVVEIMPDAIITHLGGKLLHVNPAGVAMIGARTEQELIGKPILELVHPDFHQIVLARAKGATEHGVASGRIEERLVRLDGTCFDAEVQSQPIVLAGRAAVLVTVHDITERKAAQEKLQLAANVFTHALEGIMITTPDGSIIDVNDAFTRITGYTRDDALGQNPRLLSSGRHGAEYFSAMWRSLLEDGYWYGEVWNRRKSGEVFAEMQAISAVRDSEGRVHQYISLFSDITERKDHESRLEHIAHFDALTNLPNRLLLADRLQQAMSQATRRQLNLAVAYLDLDGFKAINDHHGHETGDQVLIALAQRMKEALREGDTIARLGGDEFVAVLIDLEDSSASVPLLNRLLAGAALPVQVGELRLQLSASLGVTFYPQTQDIGADQLLRQADQSMYQAKLAGKNRYCVFDAVQDSSLRFHHESLERIRLALQRREFVLHYQPKVNMHSAQVIGAEALIRWQHPEQGLLAPVSFLPVIEDHPLAVAVGEWVIDTALTQMEVWHAGGLDLPVSVNIGARQLQQGNFVERLQTILTRHPQVHPGCIELEVLETSALADMAQVSQVIEDCAGIGVRFALDDFGTGYSSLTYLKRLRVAQLKIDRSFVRDMLDDPDDLAILQGVIGLAAAFRREVIAEGVETVAHGTALLQLGCELAQGYGIARPMPPEQLPAWAAAWQPDAAWSALPWLGGQVSERHLP